MIKILMLLEDRMPKEYYGPSNVVSSLEKILIKRNIDVSVKMIPIKEMQDSKSYIATYLLDSQGILRTFKNSYSDISSCDIVNLHYFRGKDYLLYSFLPKILNKPVIAHIYFPLKKHYTRFMSKNIQFFVAMNPYMADYLVNDGISRNKVLIIPPPIDTNSFKRLDRKNLIERYNIPPDKFVLLYHGRPSTVRGLMLFLKSVIHVKEKWDDLFVVLSLADVNEDISLKDINILIKNYKLDKMVDIIVGRNNPSEMYNLADIVLFPFLNKGAAICPPLSVPEAMACRKVVVCSDIEELGIKHIIRDGYNGFLIKPTEEDIITCLENIREVGKKTLDQIAGNACRTIQDQYSAEVVSNKLIEVMRRVC